MPLSLSQASPNETEWWKKGLNLDMASIAFGVHAEYIFVIQPQRSVEEKKGWTKKHRRLTELGQKTRAQKHLNPELFKNLKKVQVERNKLNKFMQKRKMWEVYKRASGFNGTSQLFSLSLQNLCKSCFRVHIHSGTLFSCFQMVLLTLLMTNDR